MPADSRQQTKTIVLASLLFVVFIVIGWEVYHFTHGSSPQPSETPTAAPPAATPTTTATAPPAATTTSAPPAAASPSSVPSAAAATPATNEPLRRQPVMVTSQVVPDPFKPVVSAGIAPAPPPAPSQKSGLPPNSDNLTPLQPFVPLTPVARVSQTDGPSPTPSERKVMRVTGVIMDAASPTAIVESGDEQYLLHPGESLPNKVSNASVRVVAVSLQSVVISLGKQRYQVSVGEELPFSEIRNPKSQISNPKSQIGPPAPRFTLPALDRKTKVSLSDFKGKTVLLNFFASW